MAKKKNKIETTLNRAEKLFSAGNFLLAEKEFEKVQKKLDRTDIAEKIDICRKETQALKARQLIKEGHKAVQNDKLSQAITCFEEANALLSDPLLTDKIKELQGKQIRERVGEAAQEAEAVHDYFRASTLYDRAWEETGARKFLLGSALNHVKANAYDSALDRFEQLEKQGDPEQMEESAVYSYGFALAKTGHYFDALKQWEKLNSGNDLFIEQKRRLLGLACSDLFAAIGKETDVQGAFTRAGVLLHMANALDCSDLIDMLETLSAYYRLMLVEIFWDQENFMHIAALSDQMMTHVEPAILALHAKTYFHLARDNDSFLNPMMTFWLTAIYSNDISKQFSEDPDTTDNVQQKLIHLAEQRINKHGDSPSSRRAADYLAIEKKLIKDLSAISHQQPQEAVRICTPGYALIFHRSTTLLELIRKNRSYFKDSEHYLETGGYYSKAGESLYALKTGSVTKAMALLEEMDLSVSSDEFLDYVIRLVHFEYGLWALKNGDKSYLKYFESTPALFETVPSIEKRFVHSMLQYDGEDLLLYEKLLLQISKKRRSDPVDEALSFIMTQSAIEKFNDGKINNKQVKVLIEKALTLCPGNELAIETMEQTYLELEMDEMAKAFNRNKLNKAARLVANSSYSEMYDNFFEFMEEILREVKISNLDESNKQGHYHLLLNAAAIVDYNHPFVDRVQSEIRV